MRRQHFAKGKQAFQSSLSLPSFPPTCNRFQPSEFRFCLQTLYNIISALDDRHLEIRSRSMLVAMAGALEVNVFAKHTDVFNIYSILSTHAHLAAMNK